MDAESFFTNISTKLPNFKYRVYILILIFFIFFILWVILPLITKRIHKNKYKEILHEATETEEEKKKRKVLKKILKISYIILNILILIACLLVIICSVMAKPYARLHTDNVDNHLTSAQSPIIISFDIPVEKKSIELNLSPEIDGNWEYVGILGEQEISPYTNKAVFYPDESFFPESKILVYIVGISRILPNGKIHEQAVEVFAPPLPQTKEINPADKMENFGISTNPEIKFDYPTGDFVIFEYEFEPAIKFSVQNDDPYKAILILEEKLSQDTEYKMKIFRTARSYNISTGEDIERGERELLIETVFYTVKSPSIQDISHKAQAERPDIPLKISFIEKMNKESVEKNLIITPEAEGEFSWEDEKTVVFTPKNGFAKDTEYTVNLNLGIETIYGGVMNEKVELKFKTLGKVEVSSFSPYPNSTNIDPAKTNIAITFNQEVETSSAQSKVSISPSVEAGHSWNGNQLILSTSGKLAYNTKYTVTIDSGVKSKYGLDSQDKYTYSFTTKVQTFSMAVPLYYQSVGFTCNTVATRMALAYRGVNISEAQIREGIGTGTDPNQNWVSGYGVHADPVVKYIQNYRSAEVHRGWNSIALAKEVEKGNPVILFWYNRYSQPKGAFTLASGATGYKGMHSEVVIGFTGNSDNPVSFIVNDPWRGRLTYSKSLFDSTWSYLNYTAIVVY